MKNCQVIVHPHIEIVMTPPDPRKKSCICAGFQPKSSPSSQKRISQSVRGPVRDAAGPPASRWIWDYAADSKPSRSNSTPGSSAGEGA
jgi:hypothetical protein